jgi:bacillithiol biosynthesis deacetylase BshB1
MDDAMGDIQLDCLAIGAHADDVELLAGGTLVLAARSGRRVGILDLTRGEWATRGDPETRAREADTAARILGVRIRETLDLGDGRLENNLSNRRLLVETIRRLRPRLILTHHSEDRHPDHPRACELVRDAAFFANVGNFPAQGERWKVEALAYFPGNMYQPDPPADWVVDVSSAIETKYKALKAYASQVLADPADPNTTYISSREYWDHLDRRGRLWGHLIGASHGEPFILDRPAHARHPLVTLLTPRTE